MTTKPVDYRLKQLVNLQQVLFFYWLYCIDLSYILIGGNADAKHV